MFTRRGFSAQVGQSRSSKLGNLHCLSDNRGRSEKDARWLGAGGEGMRQSVVAALMGW